MRVTEVLLGALLFAAPLLAQMPPAADPQIKEGSLVWFDLSETKPQVARTLGPPILTAEFGEDFQSWQYRMGDIDHDDFSHQLVFRKSGGTLVSITRNYESERNVDAWFPTAETTAYFFPNAQKPEYGVRVRHLPGGRLLLAMGSSKAGQPTSQVVLIREAELRWFYPWLAEQLAKAR